VRREALGIGSRRQVAEKPGETGVGRRMAGAERRCGRSAGAERPAAEGPETGGGRSESAGGKRRRGKREALEGGR